MPTTDTPTHRRDRLWEYANGPRSPRSREYMAGLAACLDKRAGLVARISNPYKAGTAQADAWYAGVQEGHLLWEKPDA